MISSLYLGKSVRDKSGVCVQVEEEGWRLDTAEDREIFQSGVPAPGPGPVLRELRPPAPPITGPCGCGNHEIKF